MDRRAKLRQLVDARFAGKQADFARAIKRSTAQVNHWLTGHRSLGDAGARHIEIELGLPQGFFDSGTTLSTQEPPAQYDLDNTPNLKKFLEQTENIKITRVAARLNELSDKDLTLVQQLIESLADSKKGLKLTAETSDFAGKPKDKQKQNSKHEPKQPVSGKNNS